MQRDNFTCQFCDAADKTLNVHHWYYGKEPWDVPNEALITTCEDCHKEETDERRRAEEYLLSKFRELGVPWYTVICFADELGSRDEILEFSARSMPLTPR